MGNFLDFLADLNKKMGTPLPTAWAKLTDVEAAQRFLVKINEYFYQTHDGIGSTEFQDEEIQYFSEFHKFWEKNHKEILKVRVDQRQATACAEIMNAVVLKYGNELFRVDYDTKGLHKEAIAQVRFFTANQDFRKPPENQYEKYQEDPGQFDAREIAKDPEAFLSFLGSTGLSQTDKRTDFARNAALFLLDRKIKAFQIAAYYHDDAGKIRQALISEGNTGYGPKKANMFLRDMVDVGVWPKLRHMEQIDVATDINVMKVALRTGILKSEIPLLSSFLDIFCHQYSEVYNQTALAWRAVWEHWRKDYPGTAPASPCMIDSLLYRIGREYCSEKLVEYRCAKGHVFYHFGGGLKKCRVCIESGVRSEVHRDAWFIPCQVDRKKLPQEGGQILTSSKLFQVFAGVCIFQEMCKPSIKGFVPLDPPQSISIKGQTGWTSSYAFRERGGGGMMA